MENKINDYKNEFLLNFDKFGLTDINELKPEFQDLYSINEFIVNNFCDFLKSKLKKTINKKRRQKLINRLRFYCRKNNISYDFSNVSSW